MHYYIQLWNKKGRGKEKEWHILTTWWMSFEGKELPSAIRWEGSGRGGGRTFIKVVGAHCRNCLVGFLNNMAVNGNNSSTQIGNKKQFINAYSSTFELLQNVSYPNEAWVKASTAKYMRTVLFWVITATHCIITQKSSYSDKLTQVSFTTDKYDEF